MTNEQKLDYIAAKLPMSERLAQAAEEAAELAQACLKYRRVITPDASPTPKTEEEALADLIEELVDTRLCLDALHLDDILPSVFPEEVYRYKVDRWYGRLKNRLLSRQWDEQLQDRDEVESENTPQTF